MRHPPHAFTLIELLVTLAVIAALLALLLPVLGGARDAARSAVCLSNLRQMNLALTGYADQHRDHFPLNYRSDGPTHRRYWFGRGETGGPATQRQLDPERGLLSPYLAGGTDTLLCPAFPYDHGDFVPKFAGPSCSYGLNYNLAPFEFIAYTKPGVPVQRDRIRRPSGVAAFADGVQYFAADGGFNEAFYLGIDDGSYLLPDPLADPNGGFAHFRHHDNAATQLVYLDGHAAAETFDDVLRTHADLGSSPAGHLTTGANGPDTIYGRMW